MRSSRGFGFFSRLRPPSNNDNNNATATTTIRRSAGANGGDANNSVDEMNPLHVPLSFLPLLLVLFALSLHGGGAASSSTSNDARGRGSGGRLEGSITTSTLYGDTFAPGTTAGRQEQYRTRPAGFGARFDYGEVYPAHLQAIGEDVHLCGGAVLHATTTIHHDGGGSGGGVYDDDEEGGRGGLLGGGVDECGRSGDRYDCCDVAMLRCAWATVVTVVPCGWSVGRCISARSCAIQNGLGTERTYLSTSPGVGR